MTFDITGLAVVAGEVIAAPPELVWDLLADVTRVGEWSPECIRATWLGSPGPRPGARFTGHNRFPNGFEYEVTCVVTEADRPVAFAWVVLDGNSEDAARPSSLWRYRIDPLPGGGSLVRQRFVHGPGYSFLREIAAAAPDRADQIIAARLAALQANMSATLGAMKAAAELNSAAPTPRPPVRAARTRYGMIGK